MKVRVQSAAIFLLAVFTLWQSGCGGSSSANQVVDTVLPPAAVVVAGTTQVFTSTVTGSDNLNSTWTCTYVYTPAPTSTTPNPTQTTAQNCTSGQTVNGGSIGTWTTNQTTSNNTLSYTAPAASKFPNPIPTITFTASAAANTKKTGTGVVTLDTGIRIAVTPSSATAPVGITPAQQIQFTAQLASGPPLNLNWKVMQPVASSSAVSNTQLCKDFPSLVSNGPCGTANPNGASCSPSCGSIDPATGIFTAPASMPADTAPDSSGTNASTNAPTVTVVVWVSGDIFHYALATITLVNASTNPITFTGIHPTTIAAGGILQDVWLDAKNILNTTAITFTSPTGQVSTIDPSNVFTPVVTKAYCTANSTSTPAITCDASIVTRIRLTSAQLATAGTGQITVNNIPSTSGQTNNISFPINLVYTKPAVVAAVPDSFPQGTAATFAADGGYYGSAGSLVELLFNGNLNPSVQPSSPRKVTGPLAGSQTQNPGLYPVSVVFDAPTTTPPPYTTATTNVAVQPTFTALSTAYFTPGTTTTSAQQIATPPAIPLPPFGSITNLVPSAMALNSTKGYAVIVEQGSNTIQLVDLAPGAAPVPVGGPIPVGNQPTSIAIDENAYNGDDLGVVVNSADSTLTLLDLTPTTATNVGTVSLAGLLPGSSNPQPYSIGIDPVTHFGIVAFSNATVGFVVYLKSDQATTPPCFVSGQQHPCAIASVSLNTGTYPQVVMQPNAPLAYVTPGNSSATNGNAGITSVVNLLLTNTSVPIASAPNGASCTNGIATITTSTPNGLNQAFPGAVLVQGVTPTTPVNFNGTFNVLAATTYTFTYSLSCSSTATTAGGGTVTFGNPYYTFNTTQGATGAAINPMTRTFAFADPNATSGAPQIGMIGTLDQTVSSITLTRGSCNGCTPIPAGAPETGVRSVSWDPFTDVLISYDPAETYNLISLLNAGGPTANGTSAGYRIIQAISTCPQPANTSMRCDLGQGSYTPAGASSPMTVYGPMVYDPKTTLVLVANAGTNTLTYLNINSDTTAPFKPLNIRDAQVTCVANSTALPCPSGGVPNGQPPLASVTAPNAPPTAVCDPTNPTGQYSTCFPQSVTVGQPATLRVLGQGFQSGGAPVVRLDGDPTGVTITSATDSEIDATVAASRLTNPHVFALDVQAGSATSNTQQIYAVQITPIVACGTNTAAQPEGVAYDDIRNVALVTNFACNTASVINLDSTNAHNYGVPYGMVMATVSVGSNPLGVDVIPRLGYAVVANNGEGSASIIDISNPLAPKTLAFTSANCTTSGGSISSTNICAGIAPSGVAIDQDRALAIIANTGGNSISSIDLTPLLQTNTAACGNTTNPCVPQNQLTATSGPPTAIAIDPNRAEAVVTNIQNAGTVASAGGLDVIALSTTPPTRLSSLAINTLTANPTGIAFDPAITTCPSPTNCGVTLAPGLFYVSSTQQNAVYTFNPDTTGTTQIRVGVNPYSLAYNYQTGTMLTLNSTSNTASIIDTTNSSSSVFTTRNTLGIGSQSQFGAAVDRFTNTAVIADQNNNRVLIMALPQ